MKWSREEEMGESNLSTRGTLADDDEPMKAKRDTPNVGKEQPYLI